MAVWLGNHFSFCISWSISISQRNSVVLVSESLEGNERVFLPPDDDEKHGEKLLVAWSLSGLTHTQLGIAYSSAAWVISPVSPVMFSHHTVPLKSVKHSHCIWFSNGLLLRAVTTFVSFTSDFTVLSVWKIYWRVVDYLLCLKNKKKVYYTHFDLSSILYVNFTSLCVWDTKVWTINDIVWENQWP